MWSVQYGKSASRDRPEVWVRSWRIVISGASGKGLGTLNQGRYSDTGSSSRSFPASRSCRIAVEVKSLVIEPIR